MNKTCCCQITSLQKKRKTHKCTTVQAKMRANTPSTYKSTVIQHLHIMSKVLTKISIVHSLCVATAPSFSLSRTLSSITCQSLNYIGNEVTRTTFIKAISALTHQQTDWKRSTSKAKEQYSSRCRMKKKGL